MSGVVLGPLASLPFLLSKAAMIPPPQSSGMSARTVCPCARIHNARCRVFPGPSHLQDQLPSQGRCRDGLGSAGTWPCTLTSS